MRKEKKLLAKVIYFVQSILLHGPLPEAQIHKYYGQPIMFYSEFIPRLEIVDIIICQQDIFFVQCVYCARP